MLRRFLKNTAISAVAYGIAGVLGLVAVGVIARVYGVAVLGLIVLVRSFLPTGFLGLFDFGVSEICTQAVARGRVGDLDAANQRVSLLTCIAGATGLIAGAVLWLTAVPLASVFKVAPDQFDAFIAIMKVTALALPITFLGLVAEGALKGFEHYGWLRVTEVGSNVAYVGAVYVLAWHGVSYEWLAYSYLGTIVAKYLVLAIVVHQAAHQASMRYRAWSAPIRKDVLHRSWLMFNSKIGGTLQQPVPPLAIGALFGPAGVGNFDLITRLPRFLKATMVPLYGAILPVSTYIDETTDTRRLQMLGRSGLVLPAAMIIPILVVVALFSEDILRVWVGPEYARQWFWLAISLCIPGVTAMLGAGQSALIVRSEFLRFNTRITYVQVAAQYLMTVGSLYWFHEKAFIIGWAFSYVVCAPVIARYMLSKMELPTSLFWQQIVKLAVVAGLLAMVVLTFKFFSGPIGLTGLIISGAMACALAWVLSFIIILAPEDRMMLGKFSRVLTLR